MGSRVPWSSAAAPAKICVSVTAFTVAAADEGQTVLDAGNDSHPDGHRRLQESTMTANYPKLHHRPTLRHVGLAVAVIIATTSLSTASFAVGTAKQQAACSGDVMRFCLSAYPDMERLKVCMTKNRDNLSPRCRSVLENG